MTTKDFINKWNVAYESKEQQLEFAAEMEADLREVMKEMVKIRGFQLGDKVSVVAKVDHLGETGMITAINTNNRHPYMVDFDEGKWCCYESSEIEIVLPKTPPDK